MPTLLRRREGRGRRIVLDGQSDFSGGLNISADASQLLKNQVRRAENCRLTVFGGLLKALGSRYIHASAIGSGNPVRGGFAWEKDDGTQQLMAVSNALLHTATYAVPATFGAIASPSFASTAVYPSFAAFRDASQEVAYIADGGKLLKWTGSALTRSTKTPNVSRVWVYNQRLYGCAGTDAILLVSGLNDGDELGYTSGEGVQVPVRTFGESSLVGGCALGPSNILFHRGGLSRWTGVTQDDIAVTPSGVSPDVGTIVPASIVVTETEAYFLSDRGFYAVNAFGVRRISTNLDPDILALFSTAANLCAAHNKSYREVCWYLPDVGFYTYNYQLQAWAGPRNVGFVSPVTHSAWAGVDNLNSPVVFVGTASGFVKQMDYPETYKDNVTSAGTGGTNVTMTVQLRRQFFRDVASVKALRFFYVLAALGGSSNAGLSWATNTESGSDTLDAAGGAVWDTPSMVWDDFTWGSGEAQVQRVQASGRGFYTDLTFTDAGSLSLPLLSSIRSEAFDYGEAHEYA